MRVLVVHATDVLARGFQSVSPDVRTRAGRPTNALLGTVRTVRRALAFKLPDRAVAVIAPAPPSGWPPTLAAQHAALADLMAVHGLPTVVADDGLHVVASYVQAALDAGDDVIVAGSDKRLAQLVGDRVWWYEGHKDVRYTPESIRKKFGVGPETVAGFLGLVGERDLLPGVKGLGKKGVIDLIDAFGSASAAVDRADEAEGRAGKALRASLGDARVQIAAATVDRACPLPAPWDALAYTEPDLDAMNATYRELEFFELLAAESGAGADDLDYAIADTPAAVAALIAGLPPTPVAVHPLIDDPSPPRGLLVGVALSAGDGRAAYVPLADDALLTGPLADWLADPERPKIGHDTKAAATALARRGVSLAGVVGDAAIASHLADPSGSAPHELPQLARTRLHRALQPADDVLGRGARRKAWVDVSTDRAGAYGCHLAEAAGALWRFFAPHVDRTLHDEALALSEVLVRMELAGMPCDADDLRASGDDFARINETLQTEIFALAGRAFSINSTKQLGTVLFEELGLPVLHKTKTGWSTATHVLERLASSHPVVPLVIRWRQLRRLQDTWVTALIAAIDDDGRVRSTFHPARSFSGRLVNSHPDLGRVPGRTPELARIRRAFRAPEGWTLVSVDYDQLGLYVLAHLTQDPALVQPLARGDDMHTATASAVLERDPADIDRDARQLGKVVNFATFAGQGASALALQLGVDPSEAKLYIRRFYERYHVVGAYQDRQLELARERGYVTTITGRQWPIGDLNSLEQRDRSYAERLARRAPHEASVADVTRRGLLRADEALRAAGSRAFPLVQIHDEVLFEVPDDEVPAASALAADAMRAAFELVVPLRVGIKVGPTWADLTPLR